MPSEREGREGECPTCGDDFAWRTCWKCGGEGVDGHNCGEDTCCCLDPEDNRTCDTCDGDGGWNVCFSCFPEAADD